MIAQVLLPRVGVKPTLGHRQVPHAKEGPGAQSDAPSGDEKKKSVPKSEEKLKKNEESKPQKVNAQY